MSTDKPTYSDPSWPFVLRPATSADAPLIARMHAQSWASGYRGILPDDFLDREMSAERETHWSTRFEELAAGAGEVVIAMHDDQPIGFLCLVAPDETGSVLVDNLHALPGAKGSGLGTAMLGFAARWASDRAATSLHLFVLEPNVAAIGFYESRGWKLAGREDDTMGGIDIIALRYVLPIG
ncbi:GNAT family N-acetyltransferase [Caballeronia sordidicola]|uniref:GNAT family N-acetyltransferase n=1 Tax=Caballeronia sordidicola TaxID=196367 RepID=UPI0004D00E6E|nr:GNAT family N-acetyltransferase [Caballeronia sordidicola]